MRILVFLVALTHTISAEINKCCPEDNVLLDRELCKSKSPTLEEDMNSLNCTLMRIRWYTIDGNGNLETNDTFLSKSAQKKYCIGNKTEKTRNKTTIQEGAFTCYPDDEEFEEYLTDWRIVTTIIEILSITSCAFFVLTFVVYVSLPELRNLHGKLVASLCGSFAMTYFHLTLVQIIFSFGNSNLVVCSFIGFSSYFWFMCSFVWLNVIAIHMYRMTKCTSSRIPDDKLFLYYNLYGWGTPLGLLSIAFILEFTAGNHVRPGFDACWFSGVDSIFFYLYAVMALIILCNIILFAMSCHTIWNKTSYDNVSHLRNMKYKLCLYLKIMFITGISWIVEVIYFVSGSVDDAWILVDLFNASQGVIYFLVLVLFRKKARKALADRGFLRNHCMVWNDNDEEEEDVINNEVTTNNLS